MYNSVKHHCLSSKLLLCRPVEIRKRLLQKQRVGHPVGQKQPEDSFKIFIEMADIRLLQAGKIPAQAEFVSQMQNAPEQLGEALLRKKQRVGGEREQLRLPV